MLAVDVDQGCVDYSGYIVFLSFLLPFFGIRLDIE